MLEIFNNISNVEETRDLFTIEQKSKMPDRKVREGKHWWIESGQHKTMWYIMNGMGEHRCSGKLKSWVGTCNSVENNSSLWLS